MSHLTRNKSLVIFLALLSLVTLMKLLWIHATSINHGKTDEEIKDTLHRKIINTTNISCNASKEDQGRDQKNRYSHLGAQYFSAEQLSHHRWYNPSIEINEADIVILPIFLTMAINGYCNNSFEETAKKGASVHSTEEFNAIVARFFDELHVSLHVYSPNMNIKYLLIAHNYALCKNYIPFTSLRHSIAQTGFRTIVGHYDNKEKNECFWSPNEEQSNTIVIPYTLPPSISYAAYGAYESIADFHRRKYALYYMGRAYGSNSWNFRHYKDRRLALHYMSTMTFRRHFGVATDYQTGMGSLTLKLPLCDTKLSSLPCGLTEANTQMMNANNELYLYGLKNSRFNLMIHGDTPTSGKFYDSIAFNLINIFVGIDQDNLCRYLPFCDTVPYEEFAFFVPIEQFTVTHLQNILSTSEERLSHMIENLVFYKKYLLWNHPQSSVVDNILRQAKRMPLG